MSQFDKKATIVLRTGKGGSGKSWSAVVYLIDDFLPNQEGRCYTNLPLDREKICAHVAKKTGRPESEFLDRLVLVPKEVEQLWLEGLETPGTYLDRLEKEDRERNQVEPDDDGYLPPHAAGLLLIDEAAKMWPSKFDDKRRETITSEFVRWLRTARHEGIQLVLMMQLSSDMSASLRRLATVELACHDLADDREYITGATYGDWSQLLSKIFAYHFGWMAEIELVQPVRDKWEESRRYTRFRWPFYFRFYKSQNREGKTASAEKRPEWVRFGWFRFFAWFLKRNWFGLTLRFGGLALIALVFGPPIGPIGLAWHVIGSTPAWGKWIVEQKLGLGSKSPDASKTAPSNKEANSKVQGSQAPTEPVIKLGDRIEIIDTQGIVMDDGARYQLGEVIQGGKYNGESVVGVDVVRGVLFFGSGRRERLRSGPVVAAAPTGTKVFPSGPPATRPGADSVTSGGSSNPGPGDSSGGTVQVR